MKLLHGLVFLFLATPAHAATIVVQGSYEVQAAEAEATPLPWSVRLNGFTSEAVPSVDPQVWEVSLTEIPTTIEFGLGPYHRIDAFPAAIDVDLFRLTSTELILNYWTHGDAGGAHSITWRMTGRSVPEPRTWLLLMSVGMLPWRYR